MLTRSYYVGLELGCLEDLEWSHIHDWKLLLITCHELSWSWLEGLSSPLCGLLHMVVNVLSKHGGWVLSKSIPRRQGSVCKDLPVLYFVTLANVALAKVAHIAKLKIYVLGAHRGTNQKNRGH